MLNFKVNVLDNFLNEKDFAELSNYAKNLASSEKIDIFHNEIDRNNKVIKSTINEEFLTRINNNYLPKALNILKELNDKKLNLLSYSDFTIVKTNKNSKFPIHDDAPNKLLSGVIFLYPQENKGTIFYNNKLGDGKTEIDWRTNRAVFFSRKERETWHSYEGDDKNDRIALVYNLMKYKNSKTLPRMFWRRKETYQLKNKVQ